jgi:tripeptide aminopeptidase
MDISLADQTIELALAIQQIPAPTFQEAARAAFVRETFLAEGLSDVQIDPVGNVLARLAGDGTARPVVVSAHLDTVFPISTPLATRCEPDRLAGPGIGDNSLGVAGLIGLVRSLRQLGVNLSGDIWLVANVGEEGLGDLCGMKAVVSRFGDGPAAYIVVEGMSLGWVYHRGLGVQRYCVAARTPGGHSWIDYGKPSAIHELARLVTQLDSLVLPLQPRTSLNVGVMQGGTSVNTISAEAHIELDLRSEAVETLTNLIGQVESLFAAANRSNVTITPEIIGQRPAGDISQDHPLVRLAMSCLEVHGLRPRLNIGSTDANIPLSRGLPAVCIGLTNGGGAHTTHEYILTQPVAIGLDQLTQVVKGAFAL